MDRLFSWGNTIKKRIIIYFIKKLIGQYLENTIREEQVEYYFSDGCVKLNNLELRKDILQNISNKIPLKICSSIINQIILRFSWSNFWKDYIYIEIPELNLNLQFLEEDEINKLQPQINKFFNNLENPFTDIKNEFTEPEYGIEILSNLIKDIFTRTQLSINKINITLKYEHSLDFILESLEISSSKTMINQISINLDKQQFIKINSIDFDYSDNSNSKSKLISNIRDINCNLSSSTLLYLNDLNLVLLHTTNLIEEHNSTYLINGISEKSFFDDTTFIQKLRENYHNINTDDSSINIDEEDGISIGSFNLYNSSIEFKINYLKISLDDMKNQLILNSDELEFEILDCDKITIKIPSILVYENQIKILDINKIGFHLEPKDTPKYYLSLGIGRIICLYDILFLNRWYNFIKILENDYHTQQNLDIFWETASSFLLMIKIQSIYLKLRIPIDYNLQILYYPYTLFCKANNLQGVLSVSKYKFRLPYMNLYLSDDNLILDDYINETNWGQKFFETERLDVIYTINKTYNKNKSSGFINNKQFLNSKTNDFYYCPDEISYGNFRKNLENNSSGTLSIIFSHETHLIFTVLFNQVGQLINGLGNYQSPFPLVNSYFIIDLTINTIYLIFQNIYAIKGININYKGAFNSVNQTQYSYLTIGDLIVWNQKDNTLIARKMDSRIKHILTYASDSHYKKSDPQSKIKNITHCININKILFEYDHYTENEKTFWLWDILKMLSIEQICYCFLLTTSPTQSTTFPICSCFEKKKEDLISNLYVSSQDIYLNYYIKGEHFQFNATQLDYTFNKIYFQDEQKNKPSQHLIHCEGLTSYLNKMSSKILIFSSNFIELNILDKYSLYKFERLIFHLTKDVIYQFKKLIGENHKPKEYLDYYISDMDSSLVSKLIAQALESSGGKSIINKMNYLESKGLKYLSSLDNTLEFESCLKKDESKIEIGNLEINFYQGFDFLNSRNLNQLLKMDLININININSNQNYECLERKITEYLISVDNYLISGDVSPNIKPFPDFKSYVGKIKPSKINYLKWKPKIETNKGIQIHFKSRDGNVSIDNDISIHLFPTTIHLTQHLINFILDYYHYFQKEDKQDFQLINLEDPKDPNYFEQFNIDQLYLQISYSSKIFDLNLPNQILLLNFLQVDKLHLIFEPYYLNRIVGYQRLFESIQQHYLEIILNQKKFKIIKSLRPVKTLVKIGSHMLNLILIPTGFSLPKKHKEHYILEQKISHEIKKSIRNSNSINLPNQNIEIIENIQELDNYNDISNDDFTIQISPNNWNTKGITKSIYDIFK